MKLVKHLLISVTTIVLFACGNQVDSNKETMIKNNDASAIEQAHWLLGIWKAKTADGDLTETL